MKSRAVILAAGLLCLSSLAAADERITFYGSNIEVARNGALTITETISVISEGSQIRHGIYRDFPTTYTDKLGRRVHVGFNVLKVTRDGIDEPYDLSRIDSGQRIKIGSAESFIQPGPHRYTVTYTTDRQIRFFDKYDELYWNVTGNFWAFPIDRAEATITLPAGGHITQFASYTGGAGSRENNATCRAWNIRSIHCWTTSALGSNEGLTVAVGFAKGTILPPTAAELRSQFIRDNASAVAAIAGLIVLLTFFTATWFEFGRDPRRGTVVPLFAPPQNFSPAAVRYVRRMGYDRKAFAASLIDMAVKGYHKIEEDDGVYTLTRTGRSNSAAGLDHGENAIAGRLFSPNNSIELKQSNHTSIAGAVTALQSTLKNEYERAYFITNKHWFFGGVAILLVTAAAAALLSDDPAPAGFLLFWLSGWSIGTTVLLHKAVEAWRDVFAETGWSRFIGLIGAVFSLIFVVPFVGGLVVALYFFGGLITWASSAALIAGGVATYVFYHLLKAPTLAGAKILDQIEGFRTFLDTAEKDRLEKLHPPTITPQVFEKFLPYAIALDCENNWSKRFEQEAAAASMEPQHSTYTPGWYSGSSFGRLGAASFGAAIGSSLASSAASAATSPSSSGSGGGGSSGGGGGGGGGGGW